MKQSIDHQIFYSHPASIVWEYLTNPDLLALWLMKNDFKPEVGHNFQFRTNPMPAMEFDGVVQCKVLEVVPLKKLVYSWKGGPGNGIITLDSIVTWTLEESNAGTTLTLHHTGFDAAKRLAMFPAMEQGWLKNMQKIDSLIQSAIDAQAQR